MSEVGGQAQGDRAGGGVRERERRRLRAGYWLDAGGRWRSGEPPADWRRDEDGRWHPTTVPVEVRVPPEAPGWQPPIGPAMDPEPRNIGGGRPATGPVEVVRSWPVWAKVLAPLAVVALGFGAAIAASSGGSESATTTTTVAPPLTAAVAAPTSGVTGTGDGSGVTPGAPCSPAGIGGATADGTPMTCADAACAGEPYDEPRWRQAVC